MAASSHSSIEDADTAGTDQQSILLLIQSPQTDVLGVTVVTRPDYVNDTLLSSYFAMRLFVLLFPLVFASSVFVPVSTLPDWLQPIAKASPVTLTANAARDFALTGGVPDSLAGSLAWIVGILAVFVPLSVWRYRRMS